MHLNREHPRFDLSMELLCSLGTLNSPWRAEKATLIKDLELRVIADLNPLITSLNTRGFMVVAGVHEHRHCVWIAESNWPHASQKGFEYFDMITHPRKPKKGTSKEKRDRRDDEALEAQAS